MQGSTRIDELRQKFHENPRRYFAPLANEYRKAGDPEQAIAICRAHLAQQPGHMSGHVVYGQALFDANRKEEARGVFEKALALDPDNAIVLKQLGDIAREKGDSSEARHWYSRAFDLDPSDREIAAYIAELTEPETEQVSPETGQTSTPPSAAPAIPDRENVEPSFVESSFVERSFVESSAVESSAVESSRTPDSGAPEVAAEPEPVIPPVDVESEPAPAAEEPEWRKTPPHEDSPFVTRTMAELYASQGYRQAALDVYRQLALHHPDDKEIFDRIEALEKDESRETAAAVEPVAQTPAPDLIPFEPVISDLPVEPHEMDIDLSPAFPPTDEDLNLEVTSGAPPGPAPHFTEVELGTSGDAWDTDSWGAGFESDEDTDLEFDSPDIPSVPSESAADTASVDEAPAHVEEPAQVEGPAAEEAVSAAEEPASAEEPAAEEIVSLEESQESPPVQATAPIDIPVIDEPMVEMSPPIGDVPVEPAAEYPPEPEEASFVAYSPQLPENEDLPHYTPQHPTVREFFAALGAFRPSSSGNVITAHAAATENSSRGDQDTSADDDYPLANDAFGNLFADAPVDDDDNRAAFVLSGAIGASTPPSNLAVSAPTEPQPAPEPPASDAPAQESEEDIRRFREWLDGLAEA